MPKYYLPEGGTAIISRRIRLYIKKLSFVSGGAHLITVRRSSSAGEQAKDFPHLIFRIFNRLERKFGLSIKEVSFVSGRAQLLTFKARRLIRQSFIQARAIVKGGVKNLMDMSGSFKCLMFEWINMMILTGTLGYS